MEGDSWGVIYTMSAQGNSDMGIVPRQFMMDWGLLVLPRSIKGYCQSALAFCETQAPLKLFLTTDEPLKITCDVGNLKAFLVLRFCCC